MGERQQGVPAAKRGTAVMDLDSGVGEEVGEDHRLAPAELAQGPKAIRLRPAIPLPGDRVANEIKTTHPIAEV